MVLSSIMHGMNVIAVFSFLPGSNATLAVLHAVPRNHSEELATTTGV